jgi:hypothetical protein
MSPENSNLERKRKAAGIAISIELGLRLQADFPEIKDMFLALVPKRKIIEELDLCEIYETSFGIMEASLSRMLRGYEGGYKDYTKIPPYPGLLPIDVVDETVSKIRSKLAKEAARKGKGIHGIPVEERIAKMLDGKKLWCDEELDFARRLLFMHDYSHQEGNHRNKPNYSLMAEEINSRFHEGKAIRSPQAVKRALERYHFLI